ncbi:MAG: ATP-dependent 6-phosphofructokinase [candidate division Zixibacteria bacterium]|nr:ATP-dependent 6-phosphofructokinase [candidate division Zixibacteria bacterium]MDH3936945.1 ATP-dependent 6-phosphofructokinase [candidate division Zixibacteria bacterium]MDH4034548.1 ATP-dependent 6-phosphofructokinase [candidate division Zixibacteria bacterium]
MNKEIRRIGVLTGGGDCPGLNAVIRAIVKTAHNDYDLEVIGFSDGYEGLIENRYRRIDLGDASGILAQGGTILGTSNRADPFNFPVLQGEEYIYLDRSSQAVRNFESLGLDALIAIGGDGTMAASAGMMKLGLPIVGVPKTIDNDLFGTEVTFGFDSACVTATDAIDKIHTTAQSHHRVMIVEVMGRYAGWLALCSGLAGGGDIVLLPEFPYDIEAVCDAVRTRNARGKNFSIVVVGEGSSPVGGEMTVARTIATSPDAKRLGGVSHGVAAQVEGLTNIECRVTILGHLLRGGSPSAFDRLLATRYGVESVHLVARGEVGRMVGLQNQQMISVPIEDVAGKVRTVAPDHPLLKVAQSLGICLGVSSSVPLEEHFKDPVAS